MAHVDASAVISTDADTLWNQVGGFDKVGDWHPWLASVTVDGQGPGAQRTAVTQDGGEQVERLEDIDRENHCYRYTMVSTALPVTNYVAEFRIDPTDQSSCTVWWSSDFDADGVDEPEAIGMIDGFLAAGVEELKRRYG
jgi:mxaD protein